MMRRPVAQGVSVLAQIRRASFATGGEQRQTATDSKGEGAGAQHGIKKQYNFE